MELNCSYLSSGVSVCFPSTRTAHNQRTAGTGSSEGRQKELTTDILQSRQSLIDVCRYLENIITTSLLVMYRSSQVAVGTVSLRPFDFKMTNLGSSRRFIYKNVQELMSPSSGATSALQASDTQTTVPHLSVLVVDAEGDGGRVKQQPRLLLVHLLPQTFHAALTLWRFLNTQANTAIGTMSLSADDRQMKAAMNK